MSRAELQQFAGQKYLNLETFKKNGEGVKTPLWFADDDGKFYIYTLDNSWKVKRLRNNARVRVAPCDMRGNVKGEWVEARAEVVGEAEAKRGQRLLDAKYGWMKKLGNFFGRLRGNKHAVIVIRFD